MNIPLRYKTPREQAETWLILEINQTKGEIIMSKVELVEENQALIIKLEQAPIINSDAIEAISKQVQNKISELDLDNLEVTEENLKEVKKVRADLNKEHKLYKETNQYIKDMVLKPYNEFKDKYDIGITQPYKNADDTLKLKINEIETKKLEIYIDSFKKYFEEKNQIDFINWEDADIHITNSKSENSIKKEIDEYLTKIVSDINTIRTLENRERIIAKYQISKDLNLAIAEVAQEIKIEEANKAKELEDEEVREAIRNNPEPPIAHEVVEELHAEPNLFTQSVTSKMNVDLDEQTVTATFKATGTLSQLKALKQFMESEGITYESAKRTK